ncbi:Serine/threonine-protein kinase smu1 [Tieghemiomyces parasiticus]|uniref:Serine/threonine-protein kinase smu1 n=1 Tax=Tieghemiomyces parasiticus TaxID=78921 RepID=A0A9W7ZLK6_9FUNG|nr:Serine/threonine-protein kinase smu1 [Tieghemiomyces parasiticus]
MSTFPREKHAESITFSPNGQYLVTGSEDGFIEVWNYLTGKLRTDLKYQAEDNCMSMKAGILSLAFSTDGELLASGSREGQIKVWTIKNGQCVRRFPAAHAEGVTSLCFSRSGSQLLSTSFDQTVRLHGLKSGKILKEYRGHTSFVNSAMFTFDMTKVLSASSDGTVKVWDYKTCECLLTLSPQARHAPGVSVPMSVTTAALLQVQRVPRVADQVVVCPRLPAVHIMTVQGKVTKSFQLDKAGEVDFTGIAVSPRGDYIYAVGTDSQLYCFATETGELSQTVKLGDSPILGLVHHPTTNTLAAFNEAGHVSLWKATS